MTPLLAAADKFEFSDFFLWSLWVLAMVIFFWLLITVFGDLFRRHDVSGGAKALWIILVIFFPLIGILLYFITQGAGMAQRTREQVEAERKAMQRFVGFSAADELEKLKKLHTDGTLTDAEYADLKRRVLI